MVSASEPESRTATRLRGVMLAAITLNLILIGTRVLLYTPFFAQRNALVFLIEPVVLLLVYAAIVSMITRRPGLQRRVALRTAATVGAITGALWVVNLAGETFTNLNGSIGILSTAPFFLAAFVLWGVAGFLVARRTGSLGHGILAAVCSAMLCVLTTITLGFLLLYTSLPHLEHDLLNDPDWLHSGWSDLRAFAIANTFFAAFTHLLVAVLIGVVVGAIGGGLGMLRKERTSARTTAL